MWNNNFEQLDAFAEQLRRVQPKFERLCVKYGEVAKAVLSRAWQVSGDSMVRGLRLALEAAPDAAAARPILQGFAFAIRLAGVVGFDELCLRFVEGMLHTTTLIMELLDFISINCFMIWVWIENKYCFALN